MMINLILLKKNNQTVDDKWLNIEQLPNKIRFPKNIKLIKKLIII